ncbi:HEAT repeat domain-containing protein [bacterium]|nr:HEAT repeat domain-containing protein [bacterium]
MFSESLDALLNVSVDPVTAGWQLRDLSRKAAGHGQELLDQLAKNQDRVLQTDPAVVGTLLRILHASLLADGWAPIDEVSLATLNELEQHLPKNASNRFLLQQLYAIQGTDASLQCLTNSLSTNPPQKWVEAAQVLSPLMQRVGWNVESFFPAALGLLQHASLASPTLDLANYLMRDERVEQHPAADQVEMLRNLLGEVVGRLGRFEDDPRSFGTEVEVVQARLAEAVALAVSLSDAVALIGDLSSIGKLHQAMELRHRRVQCEAAGALAHLGDHQGKERLIELLDEPAARLRAIHYADELGFGEELDSKYRSDDATSEAELALWLSQPQQMGVPPTNVEIFDKRRCLWPSYEHPVDVSLVRFEYNFGARSYSNVGITGPCTFAISADVSDLPTEDIYSIYAGWHVEHDDIFSVSPTEWNDTQRRSVDQWKQHLDRSGYEEIKPLLFCVFLDEKAAVYSGNRDEVACFVITDGLETIEQIVDGKDRPFGAEDLFNLYKGRKMLRTFNPDRDLAT